MGRRKAYEPLAVLLNNRLVGQLSRQASGAVRFQYSSDWLADKRALPVSLSLPLREDAFTGAPVIAVFENLLPDSDQLRRMVAEKVGAAGIDAFSLLSEIGRDCVGAMQFVPENQLGDLGDTTSITSEAVDDAEIERILKNLSHAPLGIERDQEFRISVAGAQEKTALLWHDGKWHRPAGTTPTTHIFKTQIGNISGLNLSNSVENEFYCLKLFKRFGFDVNNVEMQIFGETKALVIERFDRLWTKDNRLIRLPQEDCCQALSVPPTRKYENEGGLGIKQITQLLAGSDDPQADQLTFFKAQILNWLIGGSDAHAKNFSIFIRPGGTFQLTPLYDILSVQPHLIANELNRKQMRMSMCIGNSRHYRFDKIHGRHFVETARKSSMPDSLTKLAIEQILGAMDGALKTVESDMPEGFPEKLHAVISSGVRERARMLEGVI